MEFQKGQKPSIDPNNMLSTIAHRKDIDGLHIKDVCAFILAKMGLEFDKKYTIKEMVDRIVKSGNEIYTIRGLKFNSGFYNIMGEAFNTPFKRKAIAKIILEEPEEFELALEEFDVEVTIDSVDLVHTENEKGVKEELVRINEATGKQILIVKLPY